MPTAPGSCEQERTGGFLGRECDDGVGEYDCQDALYTQLAGVGDLDSLYCGCYGVGLDLECTGMEVEALKGMLLFRLRYFNNTILLSLTLTMKDMSIFLLFK